WHFDKPEQLCRKCHDDTLWSTSPHTGDDGRCAFCHLLGIVGIPSGDSPPPTPAERVALCRFCHEETDDAHYAGLNPFNESVECLSCHIQHFDPMDPSFLNPEYFDFIRGRLDVNPHSKRLLCGLCHILLKGEKESQVEYTLATDDPNLGCIRCHSSPNVVGNSHPPKKIPPEITPPAGWPIRDGHLTCLTCHLPGHTEEAGLLRLFRGGPYKSRSDFCPQCHGDSRREVDPHLPLKDRKKCEYCHAETPSLEQDIPGNYVLVNSLNLICLSCHDDDPHPSGTGHTLSLTAERARTIPEYFPLTRYRRMTCTSCHNPHIEGPESSIFRDNLGRQESCVGCHPR
ncbi:hypothetical protein N9903_01740, partial [bacterium]|nr:hypothetical protein [bacterium]